MVYPLSTWRGHSGAEYDVSVRRFEDHDAVCRDAAVALAIWRDEADGTAQVIGIGPMRTFDAALPALAALGATELHLHQLPDWPARRRAVIVDLAPDLG